MQPAHLPPSQMSTSTTNVGGGGPTGGYRCIAGKAPPHACQVPNAGFSANSSANATAASITPMPVLDDTTLLSLLSQSIAANANGTAPASAGACASNMNYDQQQQAQAQKTDRTSFQWNPSLTNIMAGASSQGNDIPMDANPFDNATIDQSTPRFTVEEERRELATLSIDEIISVEKDLRGVQANFGGMKLSSSSSLSSAPQKLQQQQQPSSNRSSNSSPPQAKKKKKRGRTSQATSSSLSSSKKKGCQAPPPDDAVEATDADIQRLDVELTKIDPSLKDAYLQACLQCPAEVNSRDRKAAFLEREDLNAQRAALRLVAYWQLRLDTFGTHRAFLPMTIDGAIRDDVADMIQHCVIHVLPLTDTSGRALLFYQPSRRNLAAFPLEQEGRALFYLFDSLTVDPTIRRAGFVGVADYRNVSRSQISTKQQRHMKALFEVMPIRIRSCHICHPSPVLSYAYPILKYILGRNIRLRTRLHSGTEQYVLHELASCSLPRQCLPQELGGEVSLNFAQWVANRSIVETSMALDEESMQHSVQQSSSPDAKDTSNMPGDLNDVLGEDDLSIDQIFPSEASNNGIDDTTRNVNGGDVVLTGEEARRAVIGRFTDELMAIGEAVGLTKPPTDARWKDSPGHMSSSFSEATQINGEQAT